MKTTVVHFHEKFIQTKHSRRKQVKKSKKSKIHKWKYVKQAE